MAKQSRNSKPGWLQYERHHEQLAPVSVFVKRLIGSVAIALGLIGFVLCIGIAGYHFIAGYNLVDSLLEASMILGGMGPVKELPSDGAKVFASAYALFSGLIFIAVMGLVLSPVVHRILHKFHVDEKDVQ
jgi:TRAP-type C4-dicarboxylate transport system permease small subunit